MPGLLFNIVPFEVNDFLRIHIMLSVHFYSLICNITLSSTVLCLLIALHLIIENVISK